MCEGSDRRIQKDGERGASVRKLGYTRKTGNCKDGVLGSTSSVPSKHVSSEETSWLGHQ